MTESRNRHRLATLASAALAIPGLSLPAAAATVLTSNSFENFISNSVSFIESLEASHEVTNVHSV